MKTVVKPIEAQSEKAAKVVRPDLIGTVLSTKGEPVKATVFIDSAGPKIGTIPCCPSCYADCRKRGQTDSNGHFRIEALDPELRFRILVVGEGCQPKLVGHVDPTAGPITVNLEVRTLANVPADKTVTGRVVGPSGAPIAGATVETCGILYKDGRRFLGSGFEDTDPVAISGSDEKFVLATRKDITSLDVTVQAHGYADRTFNRIAAGVESADVRMTEGAGISGRVVFQGKPLANVGVGVVSEDRDVGKFAGHFEMGTDKDGKFLFAHLPPNVLYQLYALMGTVKDCGASPVVLVQAGGDGSMADAGDLVVAKANEISGRVKLADGKPVPDKTRLMLGRENAWDSLFVELGNDGSFHLKGVPSDTMSVFVAVEGYSFSAKNKSLEKVNGIQLIGRVNGDITNLVILLDKEGLHGRPSSFAERQLLRTDPLQGVEGPTPIARNDFGEELGDVFRPSSLLLGNQAGAQPAAEIIDVPALKISGERPTWDWDASIEKRRNTLAEEYEVPLATSAKAVNSDDPRLSLANSDIAKYLSDPPWIRQMTYLHWQAESGGAVYLGGRAPRCNTELHDVTFAVGPSIESCYEQIMDRWFGDPARLHIDSWLELQCVDGHRISLQPTPVASGKKLFFINLGAYLPGQFTEIHANAFVVAAGEIEVKKRAKAELLRGTLSVHTDDLYDIDDCLEISEVSGLAVDLEPDSAATQSPPASAYHVIPPEVVAAYTRKSKRPGITF